MQKINIRKFMYQARHKYVTFNNLIFFAAFMIAAGWVWGSLQAMQRNYGLQQEVDQKKRELQLAELQKESLELQKLYYQTDEYKEIAARDKLGLVMPGEKILILPANSDEAKNADKDTSTVATTSTSSNVNTTSNMEQWLNFLFGGYSKSISSSDSSSDSSK